MLRYRKDLSFDEYVLASTKPFERDIQNEEARAIKMARLEDKLERKRGAYCFNSSDDDSD